MRFRILGSGVTALLLVACGAKTGLEIPDAPGMDAALSDAAVDAPVSDAWTVELPPDAWASDTGEDAASIDASAADASVDLDAPIWIDGPCPALVVRFSRTDVDVTFVIDRSGSMDLTWEGLPFGAGPPSRWTIVHDVLAETLPRFDARLRFGASLFPEGPQCGVPTGIAVPARARGAAAVLGLFDTHFPEGGTPTAEGLRATLDALPTTSERAQVLVLTTDGAPNCNPDTGVSSDVCVCTGPRRQCLDPDRGSESCLDDLRTVEVIREAAESRGVPVLVVGIDNPRRPDLSDALDRMADAGGWPRTGAARRFYSALEPDDLRVAFAEIGERLSTCVLRADRVPPRGWETRISMDGVEVPRDELHEDGWDWSDEDRGVLLVYGPPCERLLAGDVEVEGLIRDCE